MSGSKDRGVQFWNPQTGEAQLMLQGHKNSGMSHFYEYAIGLSNNASKSSLSHQAQLEADFSPPDLETCAQGSGGIPPTAARSKGTDPFCI